MQQEEEQEAPTVSKPERIRLWLRRSGIALFFIVLFMGLMSWPQRDEVVGDARFLSGLMLDGKPYTLAAKPAKPVLVHFWATWCPVCRKEHGLIEALAKDDFDIITVSMQSGDNGTVQKFMAEHGLSFPVLNDEDGKLSKIWGVVGVPVSFFVDTDGKVRYFKFGYLTEIGFRLRFWLAAR